MSRSSAAQPAAPHRHEAGRREEAAAALSPPHRVTHAAAPAWRQTRAKAGSCHLGWWRLAPGRLQMAEGAEDEPGAAAAVQAAAEAAAAEAEVAAEAVVEVAEAEVVGRQC